MSVRVYLFLLLAVACTGRLAAEGVPEIRTGIMDLRGTKPAQHGPIALNGPWEFYWQTLLSRTSAAEPTGTFDVPGFWNDREVNGVPLDAVGYASYRLVVLRDPGPEVLAVHVVDMESAYALYVDGRRVGGNGTVADHAAGERPEWRPAVHTFPVDGERFELVLEVSNHHHRLGGVWEPLRLGTAETVQRFRERNLAVELALAGSILMIGVYHIFLYVLRRRELSFLTLGIFAIIMVLRVLVTGERYFLELAPEVPWAWLVRLDYLSVYAGTPLCHLYLRQVFPDYGRKHFGAVLVVSTLFIVLVLATPPLVFSRYAGVFHLFLIYISAYVLYINVLALMRRMPAASVLAVGWFAFTAANMHDILYTQALISGRYLFAIGLQTFILTHSYFLAVRYSSAFELMEDFAERLRRLLATTRELAAAGDREAAVNATSERLARTFGHRPVIRLLTETDPPSATGLPVRRGEQTLAYLDIPPGSEARYTAEREYVDGVLDALGLTLENLRRAERETLAAVGQFAAEIVHDINHRCQAIFHGLTRLDESSAGPAAIERETRALKNLALDILDYARERLVVNPRPEEVSSLVARIRPHIEPLLSERGIRLVTRTADGTVPVDADRFERVVLNLANNAAEAMSGGGELRITVDREDDAFYFIFEDDGPGLSPEECERIFEPFRSGGTGAGLGLAVVRRIVRAHGGDVRAFSEPGRGSRFTVVLPAGNAAE